MRLDRDTGIAMCDYCRSTHVPLPQLDGVEVFQESTHSCPACKSTLFEAKLAQQELLYCAECRGMLVPMAGLMTLVERLRAQRDRPVSALPRMGDDFELPRLCPFCQKAMDNHPYLGPGNITVDTCSECQVIWLDKGELTRVVMAPDHAPVSSLYSPSTSDLDDEQRPRSLLQYILDL